MNSCIDAQIDLATQPYTPSVFPDVIDISGGSVKKFPEGAGNLTQHSHPLRDLDSLSDSEGSDWDGGDDVIATLSDGGRDGDGGDGGIATDDGDSGVLRITQDQWELCHPLSGAAWEGNAQEERENERAHEEGVNAADELLVSEPGLMRDWPGGILRSWLASLNLEHRAAAFIEV